MRLWVTKKCFKILQKSVTTSKCNFLLYRIILDIGLSLRTLREGTQLLIPSQTLCWIPFAIQLAIMQMRCSKAEAAVYDC